MHIIESFEYFLEYINAAIAIVVLFLGINLLRKLRMQLQKRSIWLFLLGLIFFSTVEILGIVNINHDMKEIEAIRELAETSFILSIATALFFFKESENREISSLRRSATKDALTNLNNQGVFRDLARRQFLFAKSRKTPLSLIMVDFDDLKMYNDHFGHEEGNIAINQIARILKENTRADDVVARYGGDEFVILMESKLEDARKVANQVCQEVATLEFSGFDNGKTQRRNVSVSIGIATLTGGMKSVEDLIKAADAELYRAKEDGKNRISVKSNSDAIAHENIFA